MIRKYFFMRIHVDEQDAIYARYWEPMQTALGARDNLTECMRHFMMRNGDLVKEGDVYLRKLLVQGAHHILGWRGPDTDLRRWGLQTGGARWQESEEACDCGGGAEAGHSAAPAVGNERSVRAVAPQPGGAGWEAGSLRKGL